MNKYKRSFMNWMSQNDIKYNDADDTHVEVSFTTDNAPSIKVIIAFAKDNDGPAICMFCWPIGKSFTESNYTKGVMTCQELNNQYRWVKFFLDKDKDVEVQLDAYLSYSDCGPMCMAYVRRMVSIADEAYPVFMKALWG